jgi:hypothetical protein
LIPAFFMALGQLSEDAHKKVAASPEDVCQDAIKPRLKEGDFFVISTKPEIKNGKTNVGWMVNKHGPNFAYSCTLEQKEGEWKVVGMGVVAMPRRQR